VSASMCPFLVKDGNVSDTPLLLPSRPTLPHCHTISPQVDEIYENCTYITPWEAGTHSAGARSGLNSAVRGVGTQGRPCTSFVLLVKMFTLQPTGTQIGELIRHKDSP
jgi:hypothetical protein